MYSSFESHHQNYSKSTPSFRNLVDSRVGYTSKVIQSGNPTPAEYENLLRRAVTSREAYQQLIQTGKIHYNHVSAPRMTIPELGFGNNYDYYSDTLGGNRFYSSNFAISHAGTQARQAKKDSNLAADGDSAITQSGYAR